MKFSTSILIAAVVAPSVSAFAPASSAGSSTVLKAADDCFGLPGAIAPFGYFDPLGLCKDRDLVGVKRFREAEIMHGRVAMMAVVGFLIAENTPTIAFGFEHPTIANNMIPEISLGVMFPFFLAINIAEALRANKGWVEPGGDSLFTLREGYYPGDIGFDPMGLKPTGAQDFADMQAKELSNGRLAMFAIAGMVGIELINGNPVLSDLPF
ncbi:chlorophyll a/b-binding protein [Fragilariopsis cylindrus CCMP1102]|uniref:Chlorophyll a/b-binding protein n=1 Tax=Fragilariopsis cylindrus CCMP1102 TaxID=635003 RepID=A0A1E7F771_9STRA|nr:chlorophyll a/b-binding protein [Fragilariopsis cylindrus CCMP1102]|eukprot:OEU13703.1 chlorophyll a/b-binding protein [Fragilariopsis cylindrus CCMP1102]